MGNSWNQALFQNIKTFCGENFLGIYKKFFKSIILFILRSGLESELERCIIDYLSDCVGYTKVTLRWQKAVRMYINKAKNWFAVNRSDSFSVVNFSGKSSRIICTSRNNILFWISLPVANDMLACQPIRKFRRTSKSFL